MKHLEKTPNLQSLSADGCHQLNIQIIPTNLSFLIRAEVLIDGCKLWYSVSFFYEKRMKISRIK